MAKKETKDAAAPKYLPEKVFALHRAASTDEDRPTLRVVRIEPGKAMATDGKILLTITPAEKFDLKEPFTVDAEMCGQILKARSLSGEDALIAITNGEGPPRITVGKYEFSPTEQMELFAYAPSMEQKSKPIGKVGFMVATFEKLLKSLKAVGVTAFTLEFAGPEEPVKIGASIQGMDEISGAIMPARI